MSKNYSEEENIQFKTLLRQKWMDNRINQDSSLFYVSSGALAFIMHSLTGQTPLCPLIFLFLSGLSFLSCILITIFGVYPYNSKILEALINEEGNIKDTERKAVFLDVMNKTFFSLGIVFIVIFSILKVSL